MRTFQYSDAKSHKFWNIEVSDTSFTVTYGQVGSSGETQTTNFLFPEMAQAEADKLILEKLNNGYVETMPRQPATQAEAFEDAIRANPRDLATVCAYADFLAERGDPRGEFMQVQIALENESLPKAERDALKKQEADLLKKHERDWLGPLAEFTIDAEPVLFYERGKRGTRAPVAHRFTRGLLTRLEFHDLTVAEARALVRAPRPGFFVNSSLKTCKSRLPPEPRWSTSIRTMSRGRTCRRPSNRAMLPGCIPCAGALTWAASVFSSSVSR